MQGKHILIAGCGKIGLRLAQQLSIKHQVWGLKRKPPSEDSAITFLSADLLDKASLAQAFQVKGIEGFDYVVYCLAPSERTAQAYRQVYVEGLHNLLTSLPNLKLTKRIYFISSTSVYHQNDHSWVDESSATFPEGFSGEILLQAETLLKQYPLLSTCVRFSGIYGGNRSRMIDQVRLSEIKVDVQSHITNRIHEDDCVGFLHYLIQRDVEGKSILPLYLGTDSKPVELNEVLRWISEQLNSENDLIQNGKTDSKMLISKEISSKTSSPKRRSGNKYCSNKRLLETGYILKFPSYKEGYGAMINGLKFNAQP